MFDFTMMSKEEKKIVKLVQELYKEQGMTQTIEQTCRLAINRKKLDFCFNLAKILYREQIMKELQQVILDSKNPKYCCFFAEDVEDANIKKLQQVVLDSKDAYRCYYFASEVKGADIKALQKVVIDNQNPSLCLDFARDVKGADIKALQEVVIDCQDFRIRKAFACIEGSDKRLLLNGKISKKAKTIEDELNLLINK